MAKVETIIVENGKQKIRINKDDLKTWEANDWSKCKKQPVVKPPVEPVTEVTETIVVPEITDKMSKSKIAEALEDPAFDAIRDKVDLSQTKAQIIAQIGELLGETEPTE